MRRLTRCSCRPHGTSSTRHWPSPRSRGCSGTAGGWTSRDRADDWVAELALLRLSAVPGEAREWEAGEPRTADQVREKLDRHHSVTLPPDAPFRARGGRVVRLYPADGRR